MRYEYFVRIIFGGASALYFFLLFFLTFVFFLLKLRACGKESNDKHGHNNSNT